MSLAKILKILQIIIGAGLVVGVDANKVKAVLEILTLIMEDDDGAVSK
jgi:hypothetical protein